jgi:hypothetical protein
LSLYILALIALAPFALLAFLYRETHLELRSALIWLAVLLSTFTVLAAALVDL